MLRLALPSAPTFVAGCNAGLLVNDDMVLLLFRGKTDDVSPSEEEQQDAFFVLSWANEIFPSIDSAD